MRTEKYSVVFDRGEDMQYDLPHEIFLDREIIKNTIRQLKTEADALWTAVCPLPVGAEVDIKEASKLDRHMGVDEVKVKMSIINRAIDIDGLVTKLELVLSSLAEVEFIQE